MTPTFGSQIRGLPDLPTGSLLLVSKNAIPMVNGERTNQWNFCGSSLQNDCYQFHARLLTTCPLDKPFHCVVKLKIKLYSGVTILYIALPKRKPKIEVNSCFLKYKAVCPGVASLPNPKTALPSFVTAQRRSGAYILIDSLERQ
ncbi:MAG: hypothetical protein ACKO3I_04700 [Synechococcales cyanobacterium]